MNICQRTQEYEKQFLSKYACLSSNTRGRSGNTEPCDIRTDFQRDRDRIIHSKAFRRLKHKTQVFIAPEGDHYRTRLTHTLEVAQIARTIARALRLNEDLTEAIALGHDLGHTPFGHAGERALREVCPSGFNHNEQSIRVVRLLEGGKGLNLTEEVCDGILCHTWDKREAYTLEGRIIKYADRIAYINHDIDDALRGGVILESDIPEEATSIIGNSHSERIDTLIRDIINESTEKEDIVMSNNVFGAMEILHEYLFANVYNSGSQAKLEEGKAENVVKELYRYFKSHPDEIEVFCEAKGDDFTIEKQIVDYIASMTDRYAVHIYTELFMPKNWNRY